MPDIHTIYLIQHSHTDIGYTHDQPIVWEMHDRILLEAIDLTEQFADSHDDAALKWTVEATAVLERWLTRADPRDIDRLIALERAGRIEITGLFVNGSPLFDLDQLAESLLLVRRLRSDYGFNIRAAMNCDVNGITWGIVDLLLDAGFDGFSMAINPHFGGAMKPRPLAFHWRGASGRTLPTFNGWPYNKGWELGIGRDAAEFADKWWPRAQAYLDSIGYNLPIIMIETFHPFGDNGTVFDYTPFIAKWNAQERSPRIVMATPRQWWDALRPFHDQLAAHHGDWTDFWSFGTISSAREEAISRASRARLRTADALFAAADGLGLAARATGRRWLDHARAYRDEAWRSLHLWAEHSWGADDSVWFPDSEDTASGWIHKAHYAYQARSLSLLMQRDGIAELARHVADQNPDDLLIFNPLPWERTLSGAVPKALAQPRGTLDDVTSSRHFLDRKQDVRTPPEALDALPPDVPRLIIPPTRVPAFGYTLLKREALTVDRAVLAVSGQPTVANDSFELGFDLERGGIVRFFDKRLKCDWADPDSGYTLNAVVHETVAEPDAPEARKQIYEHPVWPIEDVEIPSGWKPGWAARRSTPHLHAHRVYRTPLGWSVVQHVRVDGIAGDVVLRVFLPDHADYVECEASWHMGLTTTPEAVYVAFPFQLPDAVARYDLGGVSVIPGEDQLPGACRDYFTTQGYVDFSNTERGITIATPENPLIQLGGFTFGAYRRTFQLERPMLLGWVATNYWETNFRAHQPGLVHARYRLYPHAGGFDEAAAYRRGQEALFSEPLLQHLGEPRADAASLPPEGTLLHLPEPPVAVLHVKPAGDGRALLVRMLNVSDSAQTAEIASGLIAVTGAQACDLLEAPQEPLAVSGGRVRFEIAPRRMLTVQLEVR
jgi:hypothetical protein